MKYLRFTVSSNDSTSIPVGVVGALAVTVRFYSSSFILWVYLIGLNGHDEEAAGHKGSKYILHGGWLDGCGSCRGAGSNEIHPAPTLLIRGVCGFPGQPTAQF